jgi:hypothetical protein
LTREFFDSATLIGETSLGKPRSEPLLLLLANFKIHRKLNIFSTEKDLFFKFRSKQVNTSKNAASYSFCTHTQGFQQGFKTKVPLVDDE